MRRAGGLLLACMLAGVAAAAERNLAWYVPGWNRCGTPDAVTWTSFTNTFSDAECVFKDWAGNGAWGKAADNADRQGAVLADEIALMSPADRARLTVVGHSLGARITVRMLSQLAARGLKIRCGILMAAAIPNDDPDVSRAGGGSELPVMCVCNPDDRVLKFVYRTVGGESSSALGAGGARTTVTNMVEYAVPADITETTPIDAKWGSYESLKHGANHYAPFYFSHLTKILSGEVKEEPRPLVPQEKLNVRMKVMDKGVWWTVLAESGGWKLERHKVTGFCRILDATKHRVAWGREAEMRDSFAKLTRAR